MITTLDFLNYLLIGTSALIAIGGFLYALYLIFLNEEITIETRNLAIFVILLILASFFSGIVFVHYFIEKYSFLDFLFDYARYIALSFWFGFFAVTIYKIYELKLFENFKNKNS